VSNVRADTAGFADYMAFKIQRASRQDPDTWDTALALWRTFGRFVPLAEREDPAEQDVIRAGNITGRMLRPDFPADLLESATAHRDELLRRHGLSPEPVVKGTE
jgi:hypothetical protein